MSRKLMTVLGLIGLVAGQAAAASAAPVPQSSEAGATVAQETQRQTEALLRTVIEEIQQGKLDLSRMEPALQEAMRQQMPAATKIFQQLGALLTIEYAGNQNGRDIYRVAFQNGATIWAIQIAEDGKIASLSFQPDRPRS